jgi:vacuolar-type H+-ATPase subunit E/Vma4
MGHKELIESLQQEGEDKIRQLWKDAETEAADMRAATSNKIESISKEYRNNALREEQNQAQDLFSEAAKSAGKIMLQAEQELSDRLFPLALSCLHTLKNERYPAVFDLLVKEIPDAKWKEVRVHPDDVQIAGKYFSETDITPDNEISGGMEAVGAERNVVINNTFEKRLERAWDDLLPLLINEIYKEAFDSGTSSAS